MKRVRPTPAVEDGFHFSLTNGHAMSVEKLGEVKGGGGGFDDEDAMSYVVRFRPALSEVQAAAAQLTISYVGDKEISGGALVFSRAVRPSNARCLWLTLRLDELEYVCFETHQLRVGKVPGTYSALHVTLENTQCESGPLKLGPQLDMHLFCMPELLPAGSVFLRWFPPDIDPAQWGLHIDPRKIPQRTPLWFKLRAQLSGSEAVKRTGFFANDKPMTAFNRNAMRLGSQSEDVAALMYLGHYGGARHFTEIGTVPVTGRPGWGASPDGLVTDSSSNGQQGALEFKTSRTKLCMEPYFYPQLYMEMMALGVQWADLVRYRPARTWHAKEGKWHYLDVAHVYRVNRDAALEDWFIRVWTAPHPGEDDDKAALRAHLVELAERAKPVAILQGNEMVTRYREHRERLLSIDTTPAAAAAAAVLPDWWLAIESRTAQLGAALRNGVAVNKRVVTEQIKAYANLL